MTSQQTASAKYQALVEAIVKAVPEIEVEYRRICTGCGVIRKFYPDPCKKCGKLGIKEESDYRPITLEDVLRAWLDDLSDVDDPEMLADIVNHWRRGKPLDQQSPETIAFLHSLLLPS